MMDRVIADTSAWIQYFRRGDSLEALEVRSLMDSGRVVLVGVVYAELLRGARSDEQRETLIASLQGLPYIEVDMATWELAGDILSSLEREGQRIPLPDALIAAIAIQRDLSVYTQDAHFSRVPAVRLHEPS